MSENVIMQVLAEQREEMSSYRQSHWVRRKEEELFEFDSPLAQIVIGVRRSGKSTLCHKALMEHGLNYGYANLDDDRLAHIQTEDLNVVLSCIYQLYGTDVKYIFLDEIQNVDGWHLFVNRLLRMGLHIFVTGSNAKLLSGELATHLTGRYNEIRLFPFSFYEYCVFHHIDTKGVTTKAGAALKSAFLDYINNGGFPEMQGMRNKRGYVQSLVEAILEKDIRQRFNIRNTDALRRIANYLINNPCQSVNFDKLSRSLGVSDKTVKRYVDYLGQAFLIRLLSRYSHKSMERTRIQKAYLVDTGMQNNRFDSFASENIGWRLENVVYIELLRRCTKDFLDIYYYKPSPNEKEVDFVVCNQDKAVELVQVAFDIESPKTYRRETSALVSASEALHCNKLSLIAFTSTRNVEERGKVIRIFSALDWLLGKI